MTNELVHGFTERHVTFSLLINLVKNKRSSYVVFKPVIVFETPNKDLFNVICTEWGVRTMPKEVKRKRVIKPQDGESEFQVSYKVYIQDMSEIDNVLRYFNGIKMRDKKRHENFELFKKGYKLILKHGQSHRNYDKDFDEIIKVKLELNKHTRTRPSFPVSEWITRIKDHLQTD